MLHTIQTFSQHVESVCSFHVTNCVFSLHFSGGRQKQKLAPADQSSGCRQLPHLAPCRDLMLSVTSPNCLWIAEPQPSSWKNTPVVLHMTPSVAIMRMWHARTRRAASWPMTSTRLAEVRVSAVMVRLDGWKTRSMDNTNNYCGQLWLK